MSGSFTRPMGLDDLLAEAKDGDVLVIADERYVGLITPGKPSYTEARRLYRGSYTSVDTPTVIDAPTDEQLVDLGFNPVTDFVPVVGETYEITPTSSLCSLKRGVYEITRVGMSESYGDALFDVPGSCDYVADWYSFRKVGPAPMADWERDLLGASEQPTPVVEAATATESVISVSTIRKVLGFSSDPDEVDRALEVFMAFEALKNQGA